MNNLPTEFIRFWRRLVSSFDGRLAAAHRELIFRYQRGDDIPGYAEADMLKADTLPRGWSLANLTRLAPTRTERLLTRLTPKGEQRAGVIVSPQYKPAIESMYRATVEAGL